MATLHAHAAARWAEEGAAAVVLTPGTGLVPEGRPEAVVTSANVRGSARVVRTGCVPLTFAAVKQLPVQASGSATVQVGGPK